MLQFSKIIRHMVYFPIVSLFISSAVADWADPWIVGPPTSSAAYGRVNVTSIQSSGTLYAEEGITRGVLLATLRYNGTTAPTLSDGCKDIIELIPPANQEVGIRSLKEFDFESGDRNSDTCVFLILTGFNVNLRSLDFRIVDMNDNRPFFVKYPNTTLTFLENEVGEVYDFDATDRDQGDVSSLRYTLTTLAGDGSNFTLDNKSGIFSVTKMLDFEAGQFYLFDISVTDRGGLFSSVQVALNVIDIKDSPPVWKVVVPFVNIQEELPVGSPVFSVLAQDGDVTVNDDIVYSLVDVRGNFGIDSDTGQVKIAKQIDRDVVDFDSYFDLEITATCENYPQYKSVSYSTVFIDDINDKLPLFNQLIYDFDVIDEGFVGRLSQMDILVSDPDLKNDGAYGMTIRGPPEVSQYIEVSPTTGRNNGIFSLKIISSNLLDYEDILKRNITFEVVATEVSGNQTSQSSIVNLYARDINDNSPVFSNNYTANIMENMPNGSLVVKIAAIDADSSTAYGQSSIRYSFVESYDAARFFSIDEITGEIHTVTNIDRELIGSSLIYRVQATDKNGDYDGRRAVTGLTITIQDVNDDAPSFSPPGTVDFSVKEDAVVGSFVADFSASDADENPNLVWSINWAKSKFYKNRAVISNPSAEWEKTFVLVLESRAWTKQFLRGTTVATAALRVGDSSLPPGNCNDCPSTPLDREVFDSVQLCLTVTDLNTEMNADIDELYVVLEIGDINDNNPVFDQGIGEFTIVEGNATALGTVFGSVRASDVDVSNTITYSLSLCDNVAIDSKTGQLSTTALIDREENDFIVCDVNATDNGSPTRSSTITININVVDVNDNEPKLTVTPTQVVINECSLKSSTKNGTLISMLEATDADTGAYGTVSYLFSQQNFEGVDEFAINLTTGQMTVRNCELLDFDTKKSYSVVVEARDNYREGINLGSLSAFQRVDIMLLDVNDNSPTLQSPGSLNECYDSPFESLQLGEQVTSIEGHDDDSSGPNKWMTFALHGQSRLGDSPQAKCNEPFRMETVNNSTGKLIVAVSDMLNCTGIYDIVVQACDQGDNIEGVRCSSNTTYRICVLDVNNNYPQFIFPESDNSTIEVREDSTVGQPLLYNGTNSQLIFKATDADEGINGQIIYTWANSSVNQVFALNEDTGQVFLNSQLNRTVASYYDLVVVATDKGVNPLSTRFNLRMNVRLSNKRQPYFPLNAESLTFTENEIEMKTFQMAEDPDNANLYPGESRYDVCYYLICGNNEYFDVPDKTLNQLQTKKPLDHEQPPAVPYVLILATNDCANEPVQSCSDIDATKGQYLNITVNVKDVNDCNPVFSGSLSGGITDGDSLNTRVFPMTITDEDENDVVTCKIEEAFTVSPSSVNLETVIRPPFSISSDQWIVLLFTVQPDMKGYFTLNVTCLDTVMHSSRQEINIYVVAPEHKVDIVFDNKKEEIEAKRSEIEKIFTETMGYTCNVEKILGYDGPGTPVGNNSYNKALSHFIDESKNEAEPVLASVINAKKDEQGVSYELKRRCEDVGLTLISVGPLPSEVKDSEQLFRILFIIACVVLVVMIVLVFFFVKQTSELNRRVEALAVPKFGSQDSGINRTGDAAPNSNMYRVEGSNPIYSIEQASNSNHNDSFDNISQSSGDSIFIGVEDNPEFRDYINHRLNGKVNNGFVQEALPFETVSRRNPLMNASTSDEVCEPNYPPPPPPPPRSVKRPAPPVPVLYEDDSGEDDASNGVNDDNIDSNFSFGNVTMTEI